MFKPALPSRILSSMTLELQKKMQADSSRIEAELLEDELSRGEFVKIVRKSLTFHSKKPFTVILIDDCI